MKYNDNSIFEFKEALLKLLKGKLDTNEISLTQLEISSIYSYGCQGEIDGKLCYFYIEEEIWNKIPEKIQKEIAALETQYLYV